MSKAHPQDRRIIQDVLDAKPGAWDHLVAKIADGVWAACQILAGTEQDRKDAFGFVFLSLQKNNFQRLRAYDGSSHLETYIALVCRDVLAERLLSLFHSDHENAGWRAFEAFFKADIDRQIKRRISKSDCDHIRCDAYQEICSALVANGYRRLKAYQGHGSFTGFVLQTVDRLLIDFIRHINPKSKPTEVALSDEVELVADQSDPEDSLLLKEAEEILRHATDVVRAAALNLNETERLYIKITLGCSNILPAREIARLMRCPVEDVYKMKRRILTRLQDEIKRNPSVKKWRASV